VGSSQIPREPCVAGVADTAVQSPWSEASEAQSEGSALLPVPAGLHNYVSSEVLAVNKQGRATGMARQTHRSAPCSHGIAPSCAYLHLSSHACSRPNCLGPSLSLSLLLLLSSHDFHHPKILFPLCSIMCSDSTVDRNTSEFTR